MDPTPNLVNYYESLPDEILLRIFSNLPLGDINVLCRSSSRFANICDEGFWKYLSRKNFGLETKRYDTWYETYNHYVYLNSVHNAPLFDKIPIMEDMLLERISTNMTNDIIEDLILINNNAIFNIPEPFDLINRLQIHIDQNPNPALVCQELINTVFDPNLQIFINHNAEHVYIHVLSVYESKTNTLKPLTSLNQMRILKLSEGLGWRYPTCAEFIVYREMINMFTSDNI